MNTTLSAIQAEVQKLKALSDKAIATKNTYDSQTKNVKGEGKTAEWVSDQVSQVRHTASEAVGKLVQEGQAIHDNISEYHEIFTDKRFLLLNTPVGQGSSTIDSPLMRLCIMKQAQLMDADLIRKAYKVCVLEGNDGEAFLLAMVYNARDLGDKIDTSLIPVSSVEPAKALFADALNYMNSLTLTWKEIMAGSGVNFSIAKLTAGHGGKL